MWVKQPRCALPIVWHNTPFGSLFDSELKSSKSSVCCLFFFFFLYIFLFPLRQISGSCCCLITTYSKQTHYIIVNVCPSDLDTSQDFSIYHQEVQMIFPAAPLWCLLQLPPIFKVERALSILSQDFFSLFPPYLRAMKAFRALTKCDFLACFGLSFFWESALHCCCCWQKYLVVLTHWKSAYTTPWQLKQIISMGDLLSPFKQCDWAVQSVLARADCKPHSESQGPTKCLGSTSLVSLQPELVTAPNYRQAKRERKPCPSHPVQTWNNKDGWGFCPKCTYIQTHI